MTSQYSKDSQSGIAALGSDLRRGVKGRVLVPGDSGFDAARVPWNVSVDQRVLAVVEAEDAADVTAVVRQARLAGLAVSAQPDGHGASGEADGTILLKTKRMRGVEVDPAARVARVEAGALWGDVIPLAGKHGLTGLVGSSPGPSVVGYTLGGGLSWFGRKYGYAANSVRAFDVVDADSGTSRVTADSDPDLFWALRGGGGDFALVTAMEFDLYPAEQLYGGRILWPAARAADVMAAFRATAAEAPEELSLWYTLFQFPSFPELPEPLRGLSAVAVDVTFLGDAAEGRDLLRRFHALPQPLLDTCGPLPVTEIGSVCAEPLDPMPSAHRADLITDLSDAAAAQILTSAGPAGTIAPLVSLQVRHLGGALGRPAPGDGAAGHVTEPFLICGIGVTPDFEAAQAVRRRQTAISSALTPYTSGRKPYTFLDCEETAASAFQGDTLARLRDIKRRRDPQNVIRANFPVLG